MGNLAAESAFLDLVGSQRVGAPAGRFLTTFENAFRTHFPERRGLAMHSRTPRVPQSKKKLIELPAEAWRAPNNSRIHARDLGCALAVPCRIPTPNRVFAWTGNPAANCGLQFPAGFPLQKQVFIWSVDPAANCRLRFPAGFPLQIKCSFGVGILQGTGSEQAKPGIRLR